MRRKLTKTEQIKMLLIEAGLESSADQVVKMHTQGRISDPALATEQHQDGIIRYLVALVVAKNNRESADKMRKKMIHLAHLMGWQIQQPGAAKPKPDMERLNAWCLQYGHLHKKLNAYTVEELPTLVSQFEFVYNDFLKKQ